jgi:HEAT repeat protein
LDALLDESLPAATRSLTGSDPRSQEVIRRGFLCKALGEFTVPEVVLPVLIRAGSTNANDDELRVRLAALEAIALLLENTRHRQPPENKQLLPLLLASSENKDHKIATRAAVALAIVENDRATNRLVEMLEEPQHADVHYNVAMGLARLGHLASLEVLLEMLDPNEQRALVDEPSENARNLKQTRIYLNALRASRLLTKQNQEADLAPLERGVKRLLAEQDNPQVRIEGNATLRELQNRNAP